MGCCAGDREKGGSIRAEQKWEYINLDDFKSTSCWTPLAYGYLWLMLAISVSVYAVDTFTAINLLVFDRWSGQIKPDIPLRISRWIFAGCIILSFVLLFFRWWRAIRVIKRGGVAQSYLDPLAIRVQSIRMGREGRGWKRFLVFAELTKSRKGADYVALFSFYSFEAWLRIIFAEGPRQAVNALTLYSVMRLNLLPQGQHAATNGHTPIVQFFVNIGILADSNKLQAVILFSMLWTLVIWVVSMLSLIVSVILYIIFLWHHIPSTDKGLGAYCRRKINGRMERIVRQKVDKALKKENQLRARQQGKEGLDFKRQPTLPNLDSTSEENLPALSRQTTMTTLPEYSSGLATSRTSGEGNEGKLNGPGSMTGGRPVPPSRGMTHSSDASWASYNSNMPLMNAAGEMGYSQPDRAQTPRSASPGPWNPRPPPARSMTGMSQASQRPFTPGQGPPPPMRSMTGVSQGSQRPFSPGPVPRQGTPQDGPSTPDTYQMEPLSRTGTNMGSSSAGLMSAGSAPPLPQSRSASGNQTNPYFPPLPRTTSGQSGPPSSMRSPDDVQGRRTPASTTNPYFPPYPTLNGRNSPAPSYRSQAPSGPPQARSYTPTAPPTGRSIMPGREPTLPRLHTLESVNSNSDGGYVAFSPNAQSMSSPLSGPANGAPRGFGRPAMTPTASNYSAHPAPESSQSAYPPSLFSDPKHDSVVDILDRY